MGFTISVQGDILVLLLSGGHCGPLCMSRGEPSILSSVQVERSSKYLSRGYILKKFYCPGG